MKSFLALLAAAGLSLSAHATTIHVFLDGGQSNDDGRADPAGLPTALQAPQTDVLFYSNYSGGLTDLQPHTSAAQFGPEITFGRSMADYYAPTGEQVAVLKYAVGGTNLYSQWAAGGTGTTSGDGAYYVNFQTTINAGLSAIRAANPTATIVIGGMIWMQGESDAVDTTHSLAYGANLTAFIQDVRLTYGANLPFVIGELSVNQTGTGSVTYRDNVRAGQVSTASSVVATGIVNTDSYELKSDSLHFDAVGQQALGYAFAASMQTLAPIPEPSVFGGVLGLAATLACLHCRRNRDQFRR